MRVIHKVLVVTGKLGRRTYLNTRLLVQLKQCPCRAQQPAFCTSFLVFFACTGAVRFLVDLLIQLSGLRKSLSAVWRQGTFAQPKSELAYAKD